jgi:hypothetical protein
MKIIKEHKKVIYLIFIFLIILYDLLFVKFDFIVLIVIVSLIMVAITITLKDEKKQIILLAFLLVFHLYVWFFFK